MDKRQYYPPTPAVSHSSYCCFPNRGILSTKCGRVTIVNRLIALRNTISLSADYLIVSADFLIVSADFLIVSADFLIVSADALIVATATMRKAKNVYALSSPSILFFCCRGKVNTLSTSPRIPPRFGSGIIRG